jgi:hypothetical protein
MASSQYVETERRYNLQTNFTGVPLLAWTMPNPGSSQISAVFANFPS